MPRDKTTPKYLAMQRVCQNRYYKKNKEYYRQKREEQKQRGRDCIQHWKETHQCECGESHPDCLVFHHLDPSGKDEAIGNTVSKTWSVKRILLEIDKCVVMCQNCHMKLHARIRQTQSN